MDYIDTNPTTHLVVIGTTARYRSLLSRFSLILSRVCLWGQPHVSAFYTLCLLRCPTFGKGKYCSEIFLRSCLAALCESQFQFQLPIKWIYRQRSVRIGQRRIVSILSGPILIFISHKRWPYQEVSGEGDPQAHVDRQPNILHQEHGDCLITGKWWEMVVTSRSYIGVLNLCPSILDMFAVVLLWNTIYM